MLVAHLHSKIPTNFLPELPFNPVIYQINSRSYAQRNCGTDIMSVAGVSTRATDNDVVRLERTLKKFFKIEDADYARHPIPLSLQASGITKFEDEFLILTDTQLDVLKYEDPDNGVTTQLQLGHRNRLRCLKAFYHAACLTADRAVEVSSLPLTMFDQFRTTRYDPEAPIKPWKNPVSTHGDRDELAAWRRTVKPSKSDYKEFRERIDMDTCERRIHDHS